jgi:Ran GTPase-activating protein (RanGAP) involved in mRNA processing and transport
MPNLQKISLNSCNLDSDLLQVLSDALVGKDKLTDLNLYSNDINSEGAKVIAGLLSDKVNLKCLGLSNNYIGHGGAREIAAVCQDSLFGLTRLSLESNLIGNMGLMGLSKALIENETLEEIYLYNNEVDDDSMRAFADMLKNKKKLRVIGLEYNKIRNGAEWIFDVLKTLPVERVMFSQNML